MPLRRMPVQELLSRLRQCCRLKGGKTCPVAELGRPVEFPCPDGPSPVRVLRQLGLAAADPYVGRSAETHRLILGRSDPEDDDAALGVIHKVNIESQVRLESRPKPKKEVLVSLGLGRVRVEGRPCDSVGLVLNAEYEVTLRLLRQASRVGQGRQVLAQLVGRAPKPLELQPLRLGGLTAQPVHESHVLRRAQAAVSMSVPAIPRTSTFPVTTSEIRRVRYSRSRWISWRANSATLSILVVSRSR